MSNFLKKLTLIFTLAVVSGASNLSAQQGWFNLNLPFGGNAVYFKDVNNGIINHYKTTNAGLNWFDMGIFSGGTSVSFPQINTGYAILGTEINRTTNFGDNWERFNTPANSQLNSIYFPDINTGYACGKNGNFVKTTNSGNNWSLLQPIPQPFLSSYDFIGVYFTNTLTGWAAGSRPDSNIFVKTTNGGTSWSVNYYIGGFNLFGRFNCMFFINSETGFIGSSGSPGRILRSTNSGQEWYVNFLPTANDIYSIHFPSFSTGYASCYGGQILKTTNNGNNWFLQTTSTGSALLCVFFLNNLTGYTVGDNNTVLKTTDGGGPPIGITPISNEIPRDFALEQNFPNPFNPVTKIRFAIPAITGLSDNVKLVIYDALGSEVTVLVNERHTPGIYETSWDARNFASGVYIYRIETGDFVQSKKMVLVK